MPLEAFDMYVARLLSNAGSTNFLDSTVLDIFGGFPNNTDIGRSIGFGNSSDSRSMRISLCSSCPLPTIENPHRSLLAASLNVFISSLETLITYLSCASQHHICIGLMPLSALSISRSSKVAPGRPASCTSSGKAFDRPPAPTSCMNLIGLSGPMALHASITSCALL